MRLGDTLNMVSYVSIAGMHFKMNSSYSSSHWCNPVFSALRMYGICHELWPSLIIIGLWIGKLSIIFVGHLGNIQGSACIQVNLFIGAVYLCQLSSDCIWTASLGMRRGHQTKLCSLCKVRQMLKSRPISTKLTNHPRRSYTPYILALFQNMLMSQNSSNNHKLSDTFCWCTPLGCNCIQNDWCSEGIWAIRDEDATCNIAASWRYVGSSLWPTVTNFLRPSGDRDCVFLWHSSDTIIEYCVI